MSQQEWIFSVVEAFYARAKFDVLIGYHFRNIPDFDSHIPRIAAFWEIQLLGKTDRPLEAPFDLMKAHQPLGIKRGELGRWLVLFKKSLQEETVKHPEFALLSQQWSERVNFFEGVFLRFFRF
jgi:truncated hemoglobin YjbI